jgi:hypothetical protein
MMKMLWRRAASGAALVGLLSGLQCAPAAAATIFLKAGNFYGPGLTGTHPFNNAEIRNITFTGPLQGVVPFLNNGPALPNVSAEIMLKAAIGGTVDGMTSDGHLINENVDTGLYLDLTDPSNGATAKMMVVSEQPETFAPDAKGNLTFNVHVVADPGRADLVVPFDVTFSTGALQVPKSLRTQAGLQGGHDTAGPYAAGRVLVGRVGDFDHDGLLDGELVLAQTSPSNLVVAQGDPIAQRRPWISDIPVTPQDSIALNVGGIVQNFPLALQAALQQHDKQSFVDFGFDVTERLNAAFYDLDQIIGAKSTPHRVEERAERVRSLMRDARFRIEHGLDELTDGSQLEGEFSVEAGIRGLGQALTLFTNVN